MRALRASLIRVPLATALFATFAEAAPVANPYFPLAIGNAWTYRCSIEGEHQFDKALRILTVRRNGEERVYRAELRIRGDAHPLVLHLALTPSGDVLRSFGLPTAERELLITATPKPGDAIGSWRVGAVVPLDTPARKAIPALRVETFDIDDPALPAERRSEWRARFYAKGIGPVGEADGLGGECLLLRFYRRNP